eukprot:1293059-Amphidinium_carterae.1
MATRCEASRWLLGRIGWPKGSKQGAMCSTIARAWHDSSSPISIVEAGYCGVRKVLCRWSNLRCVTVLNFA